MREEGTCYAARLTKQQRSAPEARTLDMGGATHMHVGELKDRTALYDTPAWGGLINIFEKQRIRRRNSVTQGVRTSHAARCTKQRVRRQNGVTRRMNKCGRATRLDAPDIGHAGKVV